MWTREELKTRGREAFKANYWKCVLVALILSVITGGCSGSSGSSIRNNVNQYTNNSESDTSDSFDFDLDDDTDFSSMIGEVESDLDDMDGSKIAAVLVILGIVAVVVVICLVIGMALSAFLFNPIRVGCNRFFVQNLDEPAELSHLSRGFESNYKNVVKVCFFKDLYCFLWGLIPIAGIFIAIVKNYEYMMIPYLMAEDPDMSKEEAFATTREMMDGQKWNTFVLQLSFIGWHILSIFTCGLLELFYVAPYVHSTTAALYETLSGNSDINRITDGYVDGEYRNY